MYGDHDEVHIHFFYLTNFVLVNRVARNSIRWKNVLTKFVNDYWRAYWQQYGNVLWLLVGLIITEQYRRNTKRVRPNEMDCQYTKLTPEKEYTVTEINHDLLLSRKITKTSIFKWQICNFSFIFIPKHEGNSNLCHKND